MYAIGGRQNTAIAVRAGGRGDVTDSHVLWTVGHGSNVSSPVYHNGHIYWVHEQRGLANCLNAATGELVYKERIVPKPSRFYSSVLFADGRLYCASQTTGTYVFAASPKFELLAQNKFEEDDSRINAGPIVSNGQFLMRSDKFLLLPRQHQ